MLVILILATNPLYKRMARLDEFGIHGNIFGFSRIEHAEYRSRASVKRRPCGRTPVCDGISERGSGFLGKNDMCGIFKVRRLLDLRAWEIPREKIVDQCSELKPAQPAPVFAAVLDVIENIVGKS